MNKTRLGVLLGITLSILWGISFLSIKVAVVEIPPMTMAVYRFAIAVAVLPVVARLGGERLGVARADLPVLVAGGLTGVTLYFLGENHGVALLTASESSLVVSLIPVAAVLAERAFMGRRVAAKVYGAPSSPPWAWPSSSPVPPAPPVPAWATCTCSWPAPPGWRTAW